MSLPKQLLADLLLSQAELQEGIVEGPHDNPHVSKHVNTGISTHYIVYEE